MGGDHAPKSEVLGAIQAAQAKLAESDPCGSGGRAARRDAEASPGGRTAHRDPPRQRIHHDGGFGGEGRPDQKKDSSIRVACRLVRDGVAHGVVSAGNTGAGHGYRQDGPGHGAWRGPSGARDGAANGYGKSCCRGGCGANVDCSAEMLAQFAVMGEIYSRLIFRPRDRASDCFPSVKKNTRATNLPARVSPVAGAADQLSGQRRRPRYFHGHGGCGDLRRVRRATSP